MENNEQIENTQKILTNVRFTLGKIKNVLKRKKIKSQSNITSKEVFEAQKLELVKVRDAFKQEADNQKIYALLQQTESLIEELKNPNIINSVLDSTPKIFKIADLVNMNSAPRKIDKELIKRLNLKDVPNNIRKISSKKEEGKD
jgi:hypothetical protein